MSHLRDSQISILGLCLLLGLVVSTWLVTHTAMDFKRYPDEVVTVTGAAEKPISSDFATWQGDFTRRSNSLASAYDALKTDARKVSKFLKEAGVSPDEMSLSRVSTTTLFERNDRGYTTDAISGYEVRQTVHVESKDVGLIDRISRESSDLMAQNIYFTPQAPQFYYMALDDLKVEMLGAATKNAYERAKSMANSTQRDIGNLRTAHMGVFQITSANSTDVSDYGIHDTSARDKKVTAVVNATFQLR